MTAAKTPIPTIITLTNPKTSLVPRLPALTGIDLREDPIGDFGALLDCPYLKDLNISAWQLEQAERQLEGGELTISCG